MEAHAKRKLNTEAMFQCDECGKECQGKKRLRIHKRTHFQFRCQPCNKIFKDQVSLYWIMNVYQDCCTCSDSVSLKKKKRTHALDQESDQEKKEKTITVKKKRKKTRSRPRKRFLIGFLVESVFSFFLSYFLIFSYKFPPQPFREIMTNRRDGPTEQQTNRRT